MREVLTEGTLERMARVIADRVVQRLRRGKKRMMDIHDAAAYLGCSPATIRRRIRLGEIPSVKIGRLRRIRKVDLDHLPSADTEQSTSGS
jgi:excisionase family DNA binding protein